MITGLHVDIPGNEVKTLLEKKAERHAERLSVHKQNLKQIEDGPRERRYLASGPDPADHARQAIDRHRYQLDLCTFMAEHVVVNEIYRVSHADLATLGFKGIGAEW